MIQIKKFDSKNNVFYLSPKDTSFSNLYISVRDKEQRYLNDKEVLKLPFCSKENPHYKEWQVRQKSTKRFINYLKQKQKKQSILDIGCGNGWFSHKIANVSYKNKVIGLDININELEQASRIFSNTNLNFAYGNIYKINKSLKEQFDIIVINAAIQYFADFKDLINQLKQFLKSDGEIHIIDSPFYSSKKVKEAKQRTKQYYTKLGYPKMASSYFHHEITCIENFKKLYTPKKNIFNIFFSKKDSPFPWLCYTKK